jgi:integrase
MAWKFKRSNSANWWIGYYVNGKKRRRSSGTSDEAKADRELKKLNLLDQAHKAGSLTEEFFRLITRKDMAGDTLRGYVKQWLDECKGLSPVTVERYKDVIDEFCDHVNADEHTPLLRDVQRDTIARFLRKKRAETSTGTARLCRNVLSGFFTYCVDNDALQVNPVPSTKSLKLIKDSNASVRRAFTLAELKTLFSKAPNDFWRYMLLAGFYCGQRMGDLICLPWGAVDFEGKHIRLVTSKTGKSVAIPLHNELANFLRGLRDKAGAVKPADPIWPEQCKRYEERGAGGFSNEFYDDVLLPAGLVPKRTHHPKKKKDGEVRTQARQTTAVSFHCLRHTFVSLLKMTGANQATAKELAGHSSDAISDLYTHVPEEALTKAINQLPEVTK